MLLIEQSLLFELLNHNLDQTDTYLAKENLEMFANYYPKGEHIEEVNVMLDSVRNKLALKDFSIAMMYYRPRIINRHK